MLQWLPDNLHVLETRPELHPEKTKKTGLEVEHCQVQHNKQSSGLNSDLSVRMRKNRQLGRLVEHPEDVSLPW